MDSAQYFTYEGGGKSGLFLDLDGTLANSLGVMWQAYQDFLFSFEKVPNKTEFEQLNGPPLREVVFLLKEIHGLPGTIDELYAAYEQTLDNAYWKVDPMDHAQTLLEKARRLQMATVLVTSNSRHRTLRWLQTTGLAQWIDHVVTGEECARGKPAPDPYLKAIELSGTEPALSYAIEDAPQGAQSATEAGLRVFGLGCQSWPKGVCPVRTLQDVAEALFIRRHPVPEFRLDGVLPSLPPNLGREVEREWDNGGNHSLSDGPLIHLQDPKTGACARTSYRRFWSQRCMPQRFENHLVWPLAVTGVLTCPDGYLFAQRSRSVTQAPGYWELAPAGSMEGHLDFARQLTEEAREELGVKLDATNARPVALIEDLEAHVFDVGMNLHVDMNSQVLMEMFDRRLTTEYESLQIVPSAALTEFLATERVAAVSRALLPI